MLLATLLAFAVPSAAQSASVDTAPAPNIILVVTDDQRWDHLSCVKHPVLETPTMDGLASEGVRFSNAFVTTPICAASRASIMTSRWERGHGFTFGKPRMGPEIAKDTYFRKLREAGYRTSFVGKWGVKFAEGERAQFFDNFRSMSAPYLRPEQEHLTVRAADTAISFLPEDASGSPFCLTVCFNAPHAEDSHEDQFIPPPDLAELYADQAVPPLVDDAAEFERLPPFLQASMGRRRWGWRFDSEEKRVKRTRDYWRMISGVDRALGRILDAVEARGLKDNTVVIFTSDNGFFLGERGLAGKWLIYEESIRVPLIVMDPRAPAEGRGRVEAPFALNVDLAPTILELAGVTIPESYEGRSLLPILRGESPDWREEFLVEHRMVNKEIPKSMGVRSRRWAYALYDEQEPPYEQLFDLMGDPWQRWNLAGDPAQAARLEAFRAKVRGHGPR